MRTIRPVNYIVVHGTATPPDTTLESIRNYWKNEKGWKNPGYHYIILRDGEVVQLLSESKIANGVRGYNKECIHIAYIGGVDKEGNPKDNRTRSQKEAMFDLIIELYEKYDDVEIKGHCDFPGVTKACPSFDVKEWLAHYVPDYRRAA